MKNCAQLSDLTMAGSIGILLKLGYPLRMKETLGHQRQREIKLSGQYLEQTAPIGLCISNSTQYSARQIGIGLSQWLGRYHCRIS